MIASREKNLELVKYLVEHRADLNSTNKLNQSALIFAAQRGHLEIVKYLVENGADVNSMDENDLMYSINIRFWKRSVRNSEIFKKKRTINEYKSQRKIYL